MVNKVRVNIAGTPYAIATTDPEKYILSLAKKLDEDITKLLDDNANLSVTKAAVFCAMDYLDEYRKSTGSAENMRSQIQDYIADAARAKLAEDKVKAENEVLRREAAALREQLEKMRNKEARREERAQQRQRHSSLLPKPRRSRQGGISRLQDKGETMSKIEILAPVGNEEMLRAAVFSGADAVYLGFSGFNARTSADNFNADTLKDAVSFCHARGVAVHVALNTTVYGGELPALEQAIRAVAASGADAVICQDLAVATLIDKIAPQLPRHGSTQMSVHSLQGALELKELGFTRVVLARELSMPEVEHITKHCGIETECFVHGALCMSVSGQCYMSAFLGGRSGNRGSCAGPCRLPFEANALPEGKPGRLHHLSLKDNSVIDKLDKLQALGVASAKIEGRLRTPGMWRRRSAPVWRAARAAPTTATC